MRRLIVLAVAAAFGCSLSGCGSGSSDATSLLVVTPDPAIHADPAAAQLKELNCTLLREKATALASNLMFDGPCRFNQTAAVRCVHRVDDLYAYIHRDLDEGGSLIVSVNIEHYSGPGEYPKVADVLFQVTRDGIIYPWVQHEASAKVAANEQSITLEGTELVAPVGSPSHGTETAAGVLTCGS